MSTYHRYMCTDDCAVHTEYECYAESIVGPPETCFFNNCKVHWEEVHS